jgi:hypothetical protein
MLILQDLVLTYPTKAANERSKITQKITYVGSNDFITLYKYCY